MEQEDLEKKPLIQGNKDLAKYIAELGKDVELSISNLREKALLAPSMWAKWLSYLYHEKENLGRIGEAKAQILKKKMADGKNVSVLRMKSEDKLMENDATLQKLNSLSKMTQDNIDYIERALNILANFGFSVKNVTDIVKLNMAH